VQHLLVATFPSLTSNRRTWRPLSVAPSPGLPCVIYLPVFAFVKATIDPDRLAHVVVVLDLADSQTPPVKRTFPTLLSRTFSGLPETRPSEGLARSIRFTVSTRKVDLTFFLRVNPRCRRAHLASLMDPPSGMPSRAACSLRVNSCPSFGPGATLVISPNTWSKPITELYREVVIELRHGLEHLWDRETPSLTGTRSPPPRHNARQGISLRSLHQPGFTSGRSAGSWKPNSIWMRMRFAMVLTHGPEQGVIGPHFRFASEIFSSAAWPISALLGPTQRENYHHPDAARPVRPSAG